MHQNFGEAWELEASATSEDAGTEWLRVGTEASSRPRPPAPPLAHWRQRLSS